jgi:hypothetical protein
VAARKVLAGGALRRTTAAGALGFPRGTLAPIAGRSAPIFPGPFRQERAMAFASFFRLPPSVAAFGLIALAAPRSFAQTEGKSAAPPAKDADRLALTVYSSADPVGFDPQRFVTDAREGNDPKAAWQVPGYAIVKERRRVALTAGRNELRFDDVAQFIDPTTVSCVDATDPGAAVLEQRFEFDLASAQKLLQRYVGSNVTFRPRPDASISARLLSAAGGELVLQDPNGIHFAKDLTQIELPALPGGLIAKPTLSWRIDATKGGDHELDTTYETAGLTWRADYNLILDPSNTKADLGAWVSLLNLSGAAYADARLKLIAGEVERAERQPPPPTALRKLGFSADAGAAAGFEERSFFEYHLYTLPRRVDVPASAVQQLVLFPTVQGIACDKTLVYCGLPDASNWTYSSPNSNRSLGSEGNKQVDVYVRFQNKEENRLGIPLPKGKVRVFQKDPVDATVEFIGENVIDHTPRDEEVLLKIGRAFDVTGERVQTDFDSSSLFHTITESFRITVKNHKDAAQSVIVREILYRWSGWEIKDASDPFEKINSRTIHFPIEVPARGEKVITYTVKYSW